MGHNEIITLHKDIIALLDFINDYRTKNGLVPLRIDPQLTNAARWMAGDLGERIVLEHVDSLGRGLAQRLTVFGIGNNVACGENIFRNYEKLATAKDAFNAWRKSPGHNEIMLDPEFTRIGISYSISKIVSRFLFASAIHYFHSWVADFASDEPQ